MNKLKKVLDSNIPKWSQTELSRRSGVSIWNINMHIKRGLILSTSNQTAIAQTLGKEVEELF